MRKLGCLIIHDKLLKIRNFDLFSDARNLVNIPYCLTEQKSTFSTQFCLIALLTVIILLNISRLFYCIVLQYQLEHLCM